MDFTNMRGDDDKPIDEWNQMARVVAALLRSKSDLVTIQLSDGGDVKFALPLRPARVTRADLLKMPMAKSNNLANFLGEFFILRHQRRFETLVLRNDYERLVKACRHQHFGMWFEEGAIRLQFHLSFLHELRNRQLGELLHESDQLH